MKRIYKKADIDKNKNYYMYRGAHVMVWLGEYIWQSCFEAGWRIYEACDTPLYPDEPLELEERCWYKVKYLGEVGVLFLFKEHLFASDNTYIDPVAHKSEVDVICKMVVCNQ